MIGKMGPEVVAPRRRIAEAEILAHGHRQAAIGEIAPGLGAGRCLELVGKEARGMLHDVVKARAAALARGLLRRELGHFETGVGGQALDRLGKRQALLFDQESEDVARGLAAEAVVALRVGEHIERRRLCVRVERAEAEKVAPSLAQLHICRDKLDDVDTLFDLVNSA